MSPKNWIYTAEGQHERSAPELDKIDLSIILKGHSNNPDKILDLLKSIRDLLVPINITSEIVVVVDDDSIKEIKESEIYESNISRGSPNNSIKLVF